ncbi:MAG TPA: hypothetical protein VFT42_09685 [Solirubrobacteraceae bacterium]|nr:hypothetical protein [Solirubrobacteraceae bacterium]
MSVLDPELERPRPLAGAGASDAVTFAFADPAAELYGVARLGLTEGGASGLVVLFQGGEPVCVLADGGVPVEDAASWEAVRAAGLSTTVEEPLRSWRVRLESQEAAFDLAFAATGPIAELSPEDAAAKAGGMLGYEQPCRVRGSVSAGGRGFEIASGLGQRGHSWGAPDWERIGLARTLSAWFDDGLAVSLVAVRGARAKGAHGAEAVAATILEPAVDGGEPRAVQVPDPLLSTTYDADGRQRRAGLEMYPDPEGYARRMAGEVVCGSSLDLGRLRLDCAFFRWRMEGRVGVGRYDVLRRVDAS